MSEKQPIKTDKAAAPIGPYNQGIRWDKLIFTASVPTSNPKLGPAPEGDVKAAARNALENVKAILEEGGSGLQHLLKVTLYIRSMDDFAAINEVYAEYIPEPRPVRSLVLVQGARSPVSFDAIAYVPD
ncbi:MAG TPA: Rid family hydrolase [Chloroflexota bacterium]|jgi:2-iminobutanoate/2-iminopropanoate deaminase|nr:Rid family hydrolase [Chloroflexota bacterium]